MREYLDILVDVLRVGEVRSDRTGVGTKQIFGAQMRFDLRDGFPLVTTKKINFDLVVRELLWFLSGSTNCNDLGPAKKLWEPWAKKKTDRDGQWMAEREGYLGPVYGHQWRSWGGGESAFSPGRVVDGVDQISWVINEIKTNPSSRRLVVSAWNVVDIPDMALPPCHALFQFNVGFVGGEPHYLDLQLYQRSADLAIGVPFNIASYALLLSMVARECKLEPRYFVHTLGDAHIYLNHVEGVKRQLERVPYPLPTLVLADKSVLEMTLEDIVIEGYQSHPFIKFEVAV